jgi:hypothetical protein
MSHIAQRQRPTCITHFTPLTVSMMNQMIRARYRFLSTDNRASFFFSPAS